MEALDVNNIFILYSAGGAQAVNDLRLATSTNGGDSWSISTVVSNNDIRNPNIDVLDVNTIAISYYYNGGAFDARFGITTNGGTNWSIIDPLPGINGGTATDVYIADASNVYMLYEDGGAVYCAVSTNGGTSFTPGNLVDATPPGGFTQEKSVSGVDANTIFFSYGRPLRVAKTTNACSSFTLSDIGTGDTGFSSQIDVLDSNNIFIATYDIGPKNGYVYYTTNAGSSWEESLVGSGIDLGMTVSAVSTSDIFTAFYITSDNDLGYASGAIAPTVVSVTPSAYAVDVSVSSDITIVFDQSLNTSSVNQASLPVYVKGALVNGTYSFSTTTLANDTVTFNPTNDFAYGALVEYTLSSSISASSGATFPGASYSFYAEAISGDATFPSEITLTTASFSVTNNNADVDNDGDIDIISVGGDVFEVFLNNGDGTFASGVQTADLSNSRSLTIDDFNGDGFVDVAVNHLSAANAFSIFLNNGAGAFPARVDYATSGSGTGIDSGDIDNDGDVDIAVVSSTSTQIQTFLNNASGVFTSDQTLAVTSVFHLKLEDFNEDGFLDIAANNSGNVSVFLANGDGTFASLVNYTGAGAMFKIQTGDVTGDGNVDIISSSLAANVVSVFPGVGDGTFGARIDSATTKPEGLALGDLDADGDLDNANINNQTSFAVAMVNNGSGSFSVVDSYATGFNPSGISLGDIDGDGALDMIASGTNDSEINIFHTNTPPTTSVIAPNGGETLTSGQTYDILWSAIDGSGTIASVDLEFNNGSGFAAIAGATGLTSGNEYQFITKWGSTNGNSSTAQGEFEYPQDVAIAPDGTIWVPDGAEVVQQFDADGNYLSEFGSFGTGNGQFDRPFGIEIDSAGNIYVSDTYNDRVQKFNSAGVFQLAFGTSGSGNGQFSRPHGMAIDSNGDLYVVDAENHRVQKFDTSGNYISQFGSSGSGDGQFTFPRDLVFDSSGNIYVTDQQNSRIQKFTSGGVYSSQWGTLGTGDGQFTRPWGIAIDPTDRIFVSEQNGHRIQAFDTAGTFLFGFGSRCQLFADIGCVDPDGDGPKELGDGQFNAPRSMTMDDSGILYVADESNHRVQKFAPGGSFTWTVPAATTTGSIRATASDGALTAQDTSDATFTIIASGGGGSGSFNQQANTPKTPTGLSGQAISENSIQWNFTDNATIETGFRLVGENNEILAEVNQPNLSFINEEGLLPNTVYGARKVIALGQQANSNPSETFPATVTLAQPVTPKIISVGPTTVEVGINEEFNNIDLGDSGLYFELFTGEDAIAAAVLDSGWGQSTSYLFEDLEPELDFQVRVTARNQSGEETIPSDLSVLRSTPVEDITDFSIALSGTLVGGEPIPTPLDPNKNIVVTVNVTNTGTVDGTNVLVTVPVPKYLNYVVGSLSVSGQTQTDSADGDIGQGNGNAVSAIWPTLTAGQSQLMTFQFAFDQDLLQELRDQEETVNALAGITAATQSAANPSIAIQASVNSEEIEAVVSSASLVLVPDLALLTNSPSPDDVDPTPEPEPEVNPTTPPVITPGGPNSFTETDTETEQPASSTNETEDQAMIDDLVLTSQANVQEDDLVFMGTTSEPNTIVLIKIASREFEVVSDENGVWMLTVSSEELGLEKGDSTSLFIESIAMKEGVSSNTVQQDLFLSRATEGELVLDRAAFVNQNSLEGTFKQVQVFAQENQEDVQAALAIATPVLIISSAPLIGYLPFIPALLFHGLAALFGITSKRKDKRYYGIVYNAISKQPIGLAIIRVYHTETNKLAATQVTDKQGRYDLLLPKGSYRLEVSRPGFTFPTSIVSGKSDGMYQELYQMQSPLVIGEQLLSPPDIPLDPVNQKKEFNLASTVKKGLLRLQKLAHWFVLPLLAIGFIVSLGLVIISPANMINWVYVVFYGLLVLLQLQLRPAMEKAWGVVYDLFSGAVLPLTTIQLIDPEYNKVVKSRLSDYEGRYSFLTHPGTYIIKATHDGYNQVPHTEKQDPYHHPLDEQITISKENEHLKGDIPMKSKE